MRAYEKHVFDGSFMLIYLLIYRIYSFMDLLRIRWQIFHDTNIMPRVSPLGIRLQPRLTLESVAAYRLIGV